MLTHLIHISFSIPMLRGTSACMCACRGWLGWFQVVWGTPRLGPVMSAHMCIHQAVLMLPTLRLTSCLTDVTTVLGHHCLCLYSPVFEYSVGVCVFVCVCVHVCECVCVYVCVSYTCMTRLCVYHLSCVWSSGRMCEIPVCDPQTGDQA